MDQKEQTPAKEKSTDRFVAYNLKAKNVLFDTKTQEAYIEQETKEDLIIAMLTDMKNTLTKLEENLI